jgi:hypothetical protein
VIFGRNRAKALYTIGMCSIMWSDADKKWLVGVIANRQTFLTRANVHAKETQIESLTEKLENVDIRTRDRLVFVVSGSITKGSYNEWVSKMKHAGIHEDVVKQIFLGVEYY